MIRDATGVTPTLLPAPRPRATDAPPEAAPQRNPAMRLEPALNLVVVEFRAFDGTTSFSIPSPRELDAYRQQAGVPDPTR
jgi:hypothetical protein